MSGRKIIEGLREAVAGNFARVTIEGQTWERVPVKLTIRGPLYIFDLDGTLADCEHRRHFIATTPKDHRAFYAACPDDKPIAAVIGALKAHLAAGHRVEIWSGRSDEVRAETEAWLERHGIDPALLTRMRRAGDYRQDDVVKIEWLAEQGEDRPAAVYDDRDRLVAAWRAAGIPCFQVAPGAF